MNIPVEELTVEIINPRPRGGQHVGYTFNQLRVTHLPTGTAVTLTGRSQHAARQLAIEMIEYALSDKRIL